MILRVPGRLATVYGNFDEAGTGFSPNPKKHSNNAVLTRVQLEF